MTDIVELGACQSTQDEVRARLGGADAGTVVAVRARSQAAGRGREGRSWEDPPGDALLLSVGVQGPLPVDSLVDLPRRLGSALLAAFAVDGLAWKEPNDLVAEAGGAKVAGILVDARTVGDQVEQVVVGLGCNVTGGPFTTSDGRAATSLEALGRSSNGLRLEQVAMRALNAIVGELRAAG